MTTRNTDDGANVRVLDAAELDAVSGSILDLASRNHEITSPRDASSGLPTGKRM